MPSHREPRTQRALLFAGWRHKSRDLVTQHVDSVAMGTPEHAVAENRTTMRNPMTSTRTRQRRLSLAVLFASFAATCALTACSGAFETALAETDGCAVQVIVRHAAEPDSALLAELER